MSTHLKSEDANSRLGMEQLEAIEAIPKDSLTNELRRAHLDTRIINA